MEATENIVTRIADLIREGDIDSAIESASEFAQSESQDHRAYFTIARLVGGVADPALTERCLSRSAELWNTEPRYPLALASFLIGQNRHREAIEPLKCSLEEWPDNADAHFSIGDCYARTGDTKSAQAHLQRAIEANEAHGQAHYLLMQISEYKNRDNPHIVKMKLLTERSDIHKREAIWIAIALGRALEKTGEYPRAFSYFEKANAIRRPDTNLGLEIQRDSIENRIKLFDDGFFESKAGLGCASDIPVFVVGMPGTGGSIVDQIIAGHPRAASSGSRMTLPKLLSLELSEYVSPDDHAPNVNAVPAESWKSFGEHFVENLKRKAAKADRVVDARMANFRLIGEAYAMLPKAKFIHCVRDARDTIVSCYSKPFTAEADPSPIYDLGLLAESLQLHYQLMDHWKKMIPGNILQIEYEDMVRNPDTVAKTIIEFIDLDWDSACLDFNSGKTTGHRASRMAVCAPLHSQSIDRWKRFESKIEPIAKLIE